MIGAWTAVKGTGTMTVDPSIGLKAIATRIHLPVITVITLDLAINTIIV